MKNHKIKYSIASSVSEFVKDLRDAVCNPGYWIYSAILDTSVQFRNNRLGFLWILLSSVVFVLVLGQLYPQLLGVSVLEYSIHLYLGLTLWNFISHSITQSASLSIAHKSFLSSTVAVSLVDMVFRTVMKNLIICWHNLIPFFVFGLFVMPESVCFTSFMTAVIGMVFVVIFVISLGLVCCLCTAVLADLSEILNAVFRIGFLATPIIWMQDKISVIDSSREGLRFYIDFNPFYHLIELVRAPFLGDNIFNHIAVIFILIFLSLLIASFSYSPLKRRIEGTF